MTRASTTNGSGFPHLTREARFDENWAFVAKKEANCDRSDPDDHKEGRWDHVAFDPEHRLIVSVVPGARTVEKTGFLVGDSRRRIGGRLTALMTSDDLPAYETTIRHAYGETVVRPRTGKPGRPRASYRAVPSCLVYAVVKVREKASVVRVASRVVFGTLALGLTRVGHPINSAFLKRANGTDRHRNARKACKTYLFSKA